MLNYAKLKIYQVTVLGFLSNYPEIAKNVQEALRKPAHIRLGLKRRPGVLLGKLPKACIIICSILCLGSYP